MKTLTNKSITLTVRELLKLLSQISEEKLDYAIYSNSDGNQISNNIVNLTIDDTYKCVELTTD
jgi:hypothetical protein